MACRRSGGPADILRRQRFRPALPGRSRRQWKEVHRQPAGISRQCRIRSESKKRSTGATCSWIIFVDVIYNGGIVETVIKTSQPYYLGVDAEGGENPPLDTHLSSEGHDLIAEILVPVIRKYLESEDN